MWQIAVHEAWAESETQFKLVDGFHRSITCELDGIFFMVSLNSNFFLSFVSETVTMSLICLLICLFQSICFVFVSSFQFANSFLCFDFTRPKPNVKTQIQKKYTHSVEKSEVMNNKWLQFLPLRKFYINFWMPSTKKKKKIHLQANQEKTGEAFKVCRKWMLFIARYFDHHFLWHFWYQTFVGVRAKTAPENVCI